MLFRSDRAVDIMIAGLEPEKAKEKTSPVSGDSRTDHMARFTEQDFPDMEKGGITEALRGLLKRRRKANCGNCVFEEICRHQMQTPMEDPESGEQPPEDPIPMDYTGDQKRSIRHRDGPLRVCAGPGAGKTAALTARIRDLIEDGHSPERILAVTFTKSAAKEILADRKSVV